MSDKVSITSRTGSHPTRIRNHMFRAKTPRLLNNFTPFYQAKFTSKWVCFMRESSTLPYWDTVFAPINCGFFVMMFSNVFRVRQNLKVFNAVIISYVIFVVHHFLRLKGSADVLLHDKSMLKYPFPITSSPKITIFSVSRLIPSFSTHNTRITHGLF